MAQPPLAEHLMIEAVEALRLHGSISAAARALNLARATLDSRLKAAARAGMAGVKPVVPGFEIASIATGQDADGNVTSTWTKQKPARGPAFQVPAGHVVKGVSALTDGEGRIVAQWHKTREGSGEGLLEALKEAFSAYTGTATVQPSPLACHEDLLTLYPLPDIHFGMMAWRRETGEAFDLAIAGQMLRNVTRELISQSKPSQHALILGLGDYFHQNDQTNATPRSGHRLDVDGRWPKVYRAGADALIGMIDHALTRHEFVTIRLLPGNHDPEAAMTLTVALALFYGDHPRVTIDESPGLFFYHRFGCVLLGATHGHNVKPKDMAMVLASDRPEDWGATSHKAFFFGHIHHETAREVGPVRVESFATPTPRDAYSHGNGYRSGRSLQAITYHATRGEIGRHRVNIPTRSA
jgi:hypothetical protein